MSERVSEYGREEAVSQKGDCAQFSFAQAGEWVLCAGSRTGPARSRHLENFGSAPTPTTTSQRGANRASEDASSFPRLGREPQSWTPTQLRRKPANPKEVNRCALKYLAFVRSEPTIPRVLACLTYASINEKGQTLSAVPRACLQRGGE